MKFKLALRSLRQHGAGSLACVAGIALATGLLLSVCVMRNQASEAFARCDGGFDAVLAARGSKMQIALNALFLLDHAPGTLPAEEFARLAAHPGVLTAIPLASGDSYQGWRVVGTQRSFFESYRLPGGKVPALHSGRLFNEDAEEAVVGSLVAKSVGLSVGSHFHPMHGFAVHEGGEHEECFQVVGVLEHTNSPLDRALWVPLAGVQHLEGHDESKADALTAVLLRFRSPMIGLQLDRQYNRDGGSFTMAYPVAAQVSELFARFDWMQSLLGAVLWVVVLISAISVLAGLMNTLHGRRRDIAILRSLGARRGHVLSLLLYEALIIGVFGVVLGLAVHAGIAAWVSGFVRAETGVMLCAWPADSVFLWAPAGMLVLCLLAGLLPALQACRLPVVDSLRPES